MRLGTRMDYFTRGMNFDSSYWKGHVSTTWTGFPWSAACKTGITACLALDHFGVQNH